VPTGRHPAARVFNLIALGVGVVGLVVVVSELGWSGIHKAIVGTGAWFAVIAAIDLAGALCDAYGIRGFIRPRASVPYIRVFAAQISGIAINRLTPGNSLGEPVKVTMLVRAEAPVDAAVSAVMMFNLSTIYVGIAAIVLGVPLTALMLELPPAIDRLVWIGLAVLVAAAIAIGVLVRRGVIAALIGALTTMRLVSPDRAAGWRTRTAPIDARLRAIGDARTSGLRQGLAGVLGSRIFNWLGTIVILHAADIPLDPPLVVASLTVGILITWMSNVVPLGLGLADGTNYALYGLLGASPMAGLLFTMINRLRTIVLALMGLVVMTIASRGASMRKSLA
jgi:hypothetical protein